MHSFLSFEATEKIGCKYLSELTVRKLWHYLFILPFLLYRLFLPQG